MLAELLELEYSVIILLHKALLNKSLELYPYYRIPIL